MQPVFLTLDEVLTIHGRLVDEFGGSAGVRDMGLLQSAVAMPSAGFGGNYLHDTLSAMAAAYAFHLVQNHPFIDGNKRTAAVCARVFLLANGVTFDPPEERFGDVILQVACGEIDKATLTEFFTKHAVD